MMQLVARDTEERNKKQPYLNLARALVADAMRHHDTRWLTSYMGIFCMDMIGYTPSTIQNIHTATATRDKYSVIRKYAWKGQMLCLERIAKMEGVSYSLLRDRISRGMDIHTAVTTPGGKAVRKFTLNGEQRTLQEISKEIGISYNTLVGRLHYGWSFDDAVNIPVKKRKKKEEQDTWR